MHNTVPIPVQEAVLCVNGMKCAGCVQSVEKALGQMPGVVAASVNLVTAKATISYEPTQASVDELAIALTDLGFPTQVDAPVVQPTEAEVAAAQPETLQRLRQIGVAAVLVLLSAIGHLHQVTGWHIPVLSDLWFHWALATVALLGPGRSMLIDGWQSLWRNMPNMNTLVSLGAVTAYLASDAALLLPQLQWECFFDAPVMIVGLVLLGRTLEEQARGRATAAFQALLNLQPASARQITDMAQQPWVAQTIPIRDVTEGMQLQVLPGDKFPVDGVVCSGQSTANEAMLTGESLPVPKGPGDRVMAGTLNQVNTVAIEATCTGEQTALADIIRCVEAAQARKAPIQRLADRVSGYFVYGVMTLAALTFCFWTAIGTHLWPEILHGADSMLAHHLDPSALPGDHAGLLLGLKLAISVLVVACPCALGLATPTAIVVGTSLGAEHGILIRGGDVLEAAHRLDTIAFDKTGTLTTGNPVVAQYWLSACAPGLGLESPAQLIQWAASLEAHSQHPFATAIEAKATELGLSRLAVSDWYAHPGAGLTGTVEGQHLHLGNLSWLMAQGIEVDPGDRQQTEALTAQGQSVIFLAIQG
ncbi:MAG TPA: cation-translocating P-type ATPase, partial [Stenomitos sp.]